MSAPGLFTPPTFERVVLSIAQLTHAGHVRLAEALGIKPDTLHERVGAALEAIIGPKVDPAPPPPLSPFGERAAAQDSLGRTVPVSTVRDLGASGLLSYAYARGWFKESADG